MGLAISVGMLDEDEAYREMFDGLAATLAQAGITGYREPERVPQTMRAHCDSFPYSFLHYLRRCYALLREGKPITVAEDDDALKVDDDLVEELSIDSSSHLLCHSDAEGYYVPVDFAEPLFSDEESIGSSQRLLAELREVGPHIGVKLEADGTLSDAEAARLAGYDDGPFWREITVWLTLHEACVASIAHGTAIVFS